jgi:uncharacterized protein
MELHKGIEIIDLALFLVKQKILIIADTQIGYEESLNKKGIFIPRFQHKDIIDRLEKIINVTKPKKVIIDGDIKHEFGTISETEWRHTVRLIDSISSRTELILIRGNHDKQLGPIAKKKNLKLIDHLLIGDIYICHGDKLQKNKDFEKAKTIIIGHEHPAVALKDSGRTEKYKCFLKGKYKNKTLIVLPSFNIMIEGTDILSEKVLSPFLKKGLGDFEVFVSDKDILYFGKVKNIE